LQQEVEERSSAAVVEQYEAELDLLLLASSLAYVGTVVDTALDNFQGPAESRLYLGSI